MRNAQEVIDHDLEHITGDLVEELAKLSGKRLLILGGAGFLGYYLVQAPMRWNEVSGQAPIEVIVFDNFSRGVPNWLESLKNRPNFSIVTHDVNDPIPNGLGHVDYIIHAASIASPTYYRKHPLATMDANVNGLRRLLDYALEETRQNRPLGGFLYFSTSEIYGDPDPAFIPTSETYRGNVSCTGPRACYDESKRYGETLCVNFALTHDLPVTIARPFNNYGPGLKISDRRVIPDFARDILANRDIVLLSDGKPTRTYCYVADAIVGYYKTMINGRAGEPYNIGIETPEISVLELAERLVGVACDMTDYAGSVVQGKSSDADYLTDNPSRRCPNISKARNELGYKPGIDVQEGLLRTLVWYRENLEGEDL